MTEWKMQDVQFEADEINKELAVSPWSGHRNFAYDLIVNVRPERVVELGTHYGCSFFAFLQACKDTGLNSEIVAIDCWEGDPQAGFYGEEVLDTVKRTIAEKFPEQNTRLIRKYFSEAKDDIEDESVDIIHIDGLHTYEAVKEDFTTWLPKLKPDGIMLFHDVDSQLKYGSNDFWEELMKKYPCHYMFHHSWGLGVLFPKKDTWYQRFEQVNMKDKVKIYEYKAREQLLDIQVRDHMAMVKERDDLIASMDKLIADRDKAIESQAELIKARDEAMESQAELIKARDEAIESQGELIRARDEAMESQAELIRARDEAIESQAELIRARDEAIESQGELIRARDETIRERDEEIASKQNVITEMKGIIDAKNITIMERDKAIAARDETIRIQSDTIAHRDADIAILQAEVRKSLGTICIERLKNKLRAKK